MCVCACVCVCVCVRVCEGRGGEERRGKDSPVRFILVVAMQ